jgi:hypothetical protein
MEKNIKNYILTQPEARQSILSDIHSIILELDKTVIAEISPMMGKEMILYKSRGMMKYGLAGVKNYMSLHVLPIYASKPLYEKYQLLLNKASFQKGCINFDTAEKMPLDVVRRLFSDCAKVDLAKIREDYINAKKNKAKNKN